MNIAISLNKKYVFYACVMLTSLCINNRDEAIHVWLLNHELTEDDLSVMRDALDGYQAILTDCRIPAGRFSSRLPRNTEWPVEIYYRLLLTELLPAEVDRILYLDIDVIINQPLKELYWQDFCGNDLLAAEDNNGSLTPDSFQPRQLQMFSPLFSQGFRYFNSGVLLFNVTQLRERVSFDFYLRAMEEWDYEMSAPDQDILNYVHWQNTGYFPWERYDLFAKAAHQNGVSYKTVRDSVAIVHFAGAKPWHTVSTHYDIEQLWWDYAKLTSPRIYHQLLEDFQRSTVNNAGLERMIRQLIDDNQQMLALSQKLLENLSNT
jgi:lipopolysaccharide biosynthesis glycosyltransferase